MKTLNLIAILVLVTACNKYSTVYNNEGAPAILPFPAETGVYVGCFVDTSSRALPNFIIQSGATVESCIAAARSAGYAFAGVQYGGQCFAGNVIGYEEVPNNECNMPCAADSNEICGGTWRNSIYSVQEGL